MSQSSCRNATLLSQAAAAAFCMAAGDEALSADLLSAPTGFDWLEELLVEDAQPAASLTPPAAPQSQAADGAVPITGAWCIANPEEAFLANSDCWQQQAKAAMSGSIKCPAEMPPRTPTGSLPNLELLMTDKAYADSSLDDLLSDLPSVLNATGANGIHGSGEIPFMDGTCSNSESWQEEVPLRQAQANENAGSECYTGPVVNSCLSHPAGLPDADPSRPGKPGLSVINEHTVISLGLLPPKQSCIRTKKKAVPSRHQRRMHLMSISQLVQLLQSVPCCLRIIMAFHIVMPVACECNSAFYHVLLVCR